jgi:Ca2+-binding EF-hand superfamily protein
MPELAPYRLTQRLVAMHNADKSGHLTFVDYVHVMSALSGNQATEEKVKAAFDICNCDQSGTIDKLDLFNILRLHTNQQQSDEELQLIVESIYSKYPQGIGISEFAPMLTPSDLAKLALDT